MVKVAFGLHSDSPITLRVLIRRSYIVLGRSPLMKTEVRNPMTLVSFTSGVSHSILLSLYWMVYKSTYPPGNCQETSMEVLVIFVVVGAVERGWGAPLGGRKVMIDWYIHTSHLALCSGPHLAFVVCSTKKKKKKKNGRGHAIFSHVSDVRICFLFCLFCHLVINHAHVRKDTCLSILQLSNRKLSVAWE